jgi:spermidine synthase
MGRRSGRGSVSARESREARPEVPPRAGPDQQTAAPSGRDAAGWLRTRGFLFAVFAASGFAGLIYESIWTHYLKLFLGHAAYAQTLVLAIFMGGMALGSWISSRRSARWRNLFAAYAITEAVVGVLGLVFHEVFTAAIGLAYDVLLPRLAASAAAVSALKWGLSAALILPQSVLLGMTFPLMTAGVLRAFPDRPGRSLAMLYFTNSLGAAAGVLVSGFVLVSALGLPGTVRIAGLIDIAVAALVLPLARRTAQPPPLAVAQPEQRVDGVLLWFLGVALVTGASSFIYEVTWIRMLALVLGASTHAFELMLSAFILGLALGGLWIQRRIDQLRSPVRVLGYLQVAMGIAALATLLAYGGTFHAMRWLIINLSRNDFGYGLFNLASNGLALAIMLPATFCAGTTLPLITFHLIRRGCGEKSVGAVYAANTVGAILGVFFAIHLGLPSLGLKSLLTVGGALDIALGAALLWSAGAAFTRRRIPVALTALGAIAIVLTGSLVRLDSRKMASGVYRLGLMVPASEEVFFQRDGKTASVSVTGTPNKSLLSIRTNGKPDAQLAMSADLPASEDESTMVLMSAIPMSLHPGARTAACIGFGSGLSTHTLLANPRLSRVDTIEIEREMVEGARLFRPRNELAYTDPRSHVVIDDAKTYFSARQLSYDIIVSEPSNPWVSGVAGLFSTEFYRLVRRHLAPGGVFVQWIQLYEIDVPLVVSVLAALEANFADYVAYSANDGDLLIIARESGTFGRPDQSVLKTPAIAQQLARLGIRNLADIELRRVGTRASWSGLTTAIRLPMNSDYRPVLDQNAVRARFLRSVATPLVVFQKDLFPTMEMLSGPVAALPDMPVTPSASFAGSRRMAQAMSLRDLLLERTTADTQFVESKELLDHGRAVSDWLADCAGHPVPLTSLVRVFQSMVGELPAADLDEVWWAIASSGCGRQFSPQDRDWVGLLQAVGQRDAPRMATAARRLLEAEPGLSLPSERYLVAAGMLGSIAARDPAAARDLWARHAPSLASTEDLLLRFLIARSETAPPAN